MSVRHSLSDGPSLLLVALGLAAWEDGRRRSASGWLALAGLGRETSLLATAGFAPDNWREGAGWRRAWGAIWPAALPLIAWVVYLRWRFGVPSESGLNNFTLPLAGLVEKWGATWKLRSSATDQLLWRDPRDRRSNHGSGALFHPALADGRVVVGASAWSSRA
jgi:hypothetical protein